MSKSKSAKFFEIEKNVREYIETCEDSDGRFLIEILKKYLKPNSTVLELGIGAGKDLDILEETFKATGSDNSQIFINIYKQKKSNTDLILLDARTLKTKQTFDCIYSNKVLHHLSTEDLQKSFKLQKNLLNKNGILFHTFWRGDKKNEFQDLQFIQYEIEELEYLVKKDFNVIEISLFAEMNLNDSIYLILQTI